MLREAFQELLQAVCEACLRHYGQRLVSIAVFGSVARGTMRPDSDLDLLVVVDSLPRGRLARVREFEAVEAAVAPVMGQMAGKGIYTTLSPLIKTPTEVEKGSPVFLDMTDQAELLHDKGGFLERYLDRLRATLKGLGAKRIRRGGGYYWLLKPDYKPGEKIVL